MDTSDMSQDELDLYLDINNTNNDADMDDWSDAHNPNNDDYLEMLSKSKMLKATLSISIGVR